LVSVTAGNAQATIAWTDNAANTFPITSHNIYRGTTPGGETFLVNTAAASPYVDTGLTNGTTYYYKVSAVSLAGSGPQSGELSATPVAYVKPALLTQGVTPGTTGSVAAGYTLYGTDGSGAGGYVYLNAPKTSGKWYWEAVGSWPFMDVGSNGFALTGDIVGAINYGGYTQSRNAGTITGAGALLGWKSAFNLAASTTANNYAALSNGDVLGFALDLTPGAMGLYLYKNNVLLGNITTWTDLLGNSAYPGLATNTDTTDLLTIQLGPSGCTYAPPSGYSYV
jgi:hypothetical protein